MDPTPNAGSADRMNPPPPPVPGDTAAGAPDHGQEVSALRAWLRENAFSLVTSAVVIALVCRYLDPFDTLKVVLGLGFIVFIHELGHFLAAKWCDVHVNMFSIGFGPAVPFCQYKWGETTYKIGIIPLGGFVQMVGEGDGAESEEADDDPRSFRKKTVGQRMLIISAGVVMNIVLGMACFMAAYLHGVQEKPATVGTVESGGAAWRSGMRTGDHITKIDERTNPFFDDIRPIVMGTQKDEKVPITWTREGVAEPISTTVSPLRDEGQRFPQLGVSPPSQLKLLTVPKRSSFSPTVPGTPAASAEPKFMAGDKVVAMTDPANPVTVTPVETYAEYHRRTVVLAGKDVTLHVVRAEGDQQPVAITVKPTYRHDLGVRMRMNEIVALRAGGNAEKAGVIAHNEGTNPTRGDRIKAVLLPPNAKGERVWFVNGQIDFTKPEFAVEEQKKVVQKPLDPLLLPHQLNQWAANLSGPLAVELVVLREDVASHTDVSKRLKVDFDPSFRFDRESCSLPNSPLPISGLGLGYWVDAGVDEVTPNGPAAAAGVQRDDVIVAVRFKSRDAAGNLKAGEWKDDLKSYQWASADAGFQGGPSELDVRVKRGDDVKEFTITGVEHKEFPTDDRGLIFQTENQIQKAADVGDAVRLGAQRTTRFIKVVYMNLYAMAFGRVSVKTMSGPLTIATVSYRFAGEDFWQFLLFLGMISVNLAVVNFLPIPVLDGGHMVFLLLEKILGRPVPERLFAVAMYTGLFLILSLMVFVITLDVRRLFFGWF